MSLDEGDLARAKRALDRMVDHRESCSGCLADAKIVGSYLDKACAPAVDSPDYTCQICKKSWYTKIPEEMCPHSAQVVINAANRRIKELEKQLWSMHTWRSEAYREALESVAEELERRSIEISTGKTAAYYVRHHKVR